MIAYADLGTFHVKRRESSGVISTTLNSKRYTFSLNRTAMSSRPWLLLSSTVMSKPKPAK